MINARLWDDLLREQLMIPTLGSVLHDYAFDRIYAAIHYRDA